MQRRAYASGIALSAALVLAGCTGGSGADGGSGDAKPGSATSSTEAAPPGKYRTLPDPCRSVGRATLASLLPGTGALDEEERKKAFEGEAAITYDTDRRVGCGWKITSENATRLLHLDFERVVSYDSAVSDAARAEGLYAKREIAADLPAPSDPRQEASADGSPTDGASGSPSATADGASPSPGPSGSTTEPSTEPTAEPTAEAPAEGLEPRALKDLGDDAFIDDELAPATRQRTVSVVFRTSNVLVTVTYDEQPTVLSTVPSSKNMQEKTQGLARELTQLFDE